MEKECKRVIDTAPKTEGPTNAPVELIAQVTKTQAQNVRRYENHKLTKLYVKNADAYFAKEYPGSVTGTGAFGNARVVCGIRPFLVSQLIQQDQICVDATYWIGRRGRRRGCP